MSAVKQSDDAVKGETCCHLAHHAAGTRVLCTIVHDRPAPLEKAKAFSGKRQLAAS